MAKRIRKFYLKSKLNFGRFSGKTVWEVINMGEAPYLRWCNARMDKITFASECKQAWGKDCPIGHEHMGNVESEEDDVPDMYAGYGDSDPNDHSAKF